jgi:drug/metabolite transporter (DMT)-like permease
MSGIIAAIYASFFLAFAQASLKKSYKELEPSVAFAFDMLFGLILWIPLALHFGVSYPQILKVLPYAVVSAILSEALYFYALSKGQLSITSILIGSYPVYTIFFSILINKEVLSSKQLLFVILTILGTLITYIPSKLKWSELRKSQAVVWAIIAAIAVGLSDTLSKRIINVTQDYTFLFVLAFVQIPVALVYLKIEKQSIFSNVKSAVKNVEDYKNAIAGSLFNILGTGLLWISFSKTLASIASPITATSGALVLIIALLFLDEKVRLRQLAGILFVIIGIFGLAG